MKILTLSLDTILVSNFPRFNIRAYKISYGDATRSGEIRIFAVSVIICAVTIDVSVFANSTDVTSVKSARCRGFVAGKKYQPLRHLIIEVLEATAMQRVETNPYREEKRRFGTNKSAIVQAIIKPIEHHYADDHWRDCIEFIVASTHNLFNQLDSFFSRSNGFSFSAK